QGTYRVRFSVQTALGNMYGYPPILQSGEAFATILLRAGLSARAFTSGGDRTIRLESGKPYWCVHVQSTDASFDPSQIDPGTVRLISPGTGRVDRIPAVTADTAFRDSD